MGGVGVWIAHDAGDQNQCDEQHFIVKGAFLLVVHDGFTDEVIVAGQFRITGIVQLVNELSGFCGLAGIGGAEEFAAFLCSIPAGTAVFH